MMKDLVVWICTMVKLLQDRLQHIYLDPIRKLFDGENIIILSNF